MNFKESVTDLFNGLAHLAYPQLCVACNRPLVKGEQAICILCELDLPETNYHKQPGNPVEHHFWGRVRIERAASLFSFSKGSRVQHLLHEFKYNHKREIGEIMGRYYGRKLAQAPVFKDCEVVVPVPLHPKKEFKRGYNQSAVFGTGLAEAMEINFQKSALERKVFTETQTRKGRLERWENVETVFTASNPDKLRNKQLLLVDDVITTGATMEACAQVLLAIPGVQVCAVSMASAQ